MIQKHVYCIKTPMLESKGLPYTPYSINNQLGFI